MYCWESQDVGGGPTPSERALFQGLGLAVYAEAGGFLRAPPTPQTENYKLAAGLRAQAHPCIPAGLSWVQALGWLALQMDSGTVVAWEVQESAGS